MAARPRNYFMWTKRSPVSGDLLLSGSSARHICRRPDHRLPLATIVTNDDHDRASQLERDGAFRGIEKETYRSLFGPQPAGYGDENGLDTGHDYTQRDTLLPHPVYASMCWVCVVNPSKATFESLKSLLAEAHALARSHHAAQMTRT